MAAQRRVIVGGSIAAQPVGSGGLVSAFMQWVLGFRRLGWDTYYVEEIDGRRCIDEQWQVVPFERSANRRHFQAVMQQFDMLDRSALLDVGQDQSFGLSHDQIDELARDADLFINLSGRFHRRRTLDAVRQRVYVDLDPGFVQIWQQHYNADMNLAGHDLYLTVGLNLGSSDCPFPTCGLEWHPTLPPVVIDQWQTSLPAGDAYTTVADWRGYSPVQWDGVWYGQKSEQFLKIIDLPRRVSVPLELCLSIHPDEPDLPRLRAHGWRLSSPQTHADSFDHYRHYIQSSRGECTAVKQGYSAGNSGWVSDRSVCYLAAGRPVIIEDTGLAKHLPLGAGLLTFGDTESAAAAIRSVEADYAAHCAAAGELARTRCASDVVLGNLLELAGL